MEDTREIVDNLMFLEAEYQSADWNYRKTLEGDISNMIQSITSKKDLLEVKEALRILPDDSKVKEMVERETL